MSVTSTYTGWVPLGGLSEARIRLGQDVAHIDGYAVGHAVTRWPGGALHEPDAAPPDPIPEVWLSYPTIAPNVRVVTLTSRSDLHRADAEAQAVSLCTMLAHAGLVQDWPEGTDFRALPGRLSQRPLILGCFEFPALTVWAGADFAVRLVASERETVALCAPPRTLARFGLSLA